MSLLKVVDGFGFENQQPMVGFVTIGTSATLPS
jgi:hypothetical protein